MKKKLIVLSGFVLGLAPVVVLAQATTGFLGVNCTTEAAGSIGFMLCKLNQLLTTVVPVLIALGVVYFVWGIITYVISSDEEAKKAGRDRIIFRIIGLAVIIAVWGLVRILTNTFGVSTATQNINFPTTSF